eukprot:TRINITY_DN9339_c0_g1_i1.p1 TRINITY_DN9339_c0_g1~~TRINITY_DN9339_c0_g1_i1.p1  ORF type:complete len:308 (-),score=61.32 TRINITY_DN9339_c0_g1_i1:89-937(-)
MVDIMKHMEFLGPIGYSLSQGERAGLQVSMVQRQQEESLSMPLKFWGKLLADEADYLICYSLRAPELEEGIFPMRQYYYATSNDTLLRQMPTLSAEQKSLAAAVPKGQRFKGDPSLPLDAEPEEEEADESEEPKAAPERFRELHRLAYTVAQIDHDVTVTPKGAMLMEASRRVVPNRYFEGLSYEAAGNIRNYFHCRGPETPAAAAALTRKGLVSDTDFLDPLAGDRPQGVWSLTRDTTNTMACLRSLAWPGYFFFTQIGSGEHGGVYFGTGLPNTDLAFML